MKILIAEDDVTSRNILTAVLKKWGYDPLVTENGLAAWNELQRPDAPKMILLDWNMPEPDGLEICRRIRKIESPEPPYIIMLTSRDEKSDIVQGLEAGANDYIPKPYDSSELRARIMVGQRMLKLQSSLSEAQKVLAHQAMHDSLTGIFNRRAILDLLAGELNRVQRDDKQLSIGMCDIDHFKKINDAFGHQAGDEVLVAFAQIVQECLRKHDYIGRYGGEEFIIITSNNKGDAYLSPFERIRERIADARIETNAGPVSITVSIGVASGSGQDTAALLTAADKALYRAKTTGRNRVSFYCRTDQAA